MSNTNDMRRDFEAWANTLDLDLKRFNDGYSDCNTDYAWFAYRAATERATALERERAAVLAYQAGMDGLAHAIRQGGAECQDAIYVSFDDGDTSRKGRALLPSKPRKGVV